MKKKYREIKVNGIMYAWLIRYNDTIVIFKDKKIIYEQRAGIWLIYSDSITPAVIENIIKSLQTN